MKTIVQQFISNLIKSGISIKDAIKATVENFFDWRITFKKNGKVLSASQRFYLRFDGTKVPYPTGL